MVPPPFASTVARASSCNINTSITFMLIRNETYPAHVGIWMELPTRWTPSLLGSCDLARIRNQETHKSPSCWSAQRLGPQSGSNCKNVRIFGAKAGTRKCEIRNPKMGPKIGPWLLPCYYNYKAGNISGHRFWTPKMCSKACFSGPFFGV